MISDYAALNQLPGDYKSQIELSINAGMDMVMVPDKYREFFDTLIDLVGAAIQMANTFLDVSINTTSIEVKERCLAKAEKTHRRMTELVQSSAPERVDLIAALDELQWRHKRLKL